MNVYPSDLSTLNNYLIAERGARIARRVDREYREYLREAQRSPPGYRAREVVLDQRGQATEADMPVIVVWCVACVLWSSTFLFIRLGLQQIPPFTFASLRLALALVVLAPMALARVGGPSLGRRDLLHIAGAGVLLLSANYALVFWGAQFIDSGLVAILLSATPLIALIFGWLFRSERVTALKIVA